MAGPRTSIGIMFQDSTLLPWKSALDNVLFPIRILKRPLDDYRDSARATARPRRSRTASQHKKPHELSGGMRQRVAICRALVYDPELLLMDEPFSALDAITRDEMNELLLDLWQQYTKTALFVTHSIREAVMLADRVLVMTRRPATIVEDLTIPFARPRDDGDRREPRVQRDLRPSARAHRGEPLPRVEDRRGLGAAGARRMTAESHAAPRFAAGPTGIASPAILGPSLRQLRPIILPLATAGAVR